MAATLVIELEGRGERRRLESGRLSIGRSQGNDWIIAEQGQPSVSRQHCVLESTGDGFAVTDLGSTNGTQLNDRPLPPNQPARIGDGDRLKVGRNILRLSLERAGAAMALDLAAPVERPARSTTPVRPALGGTRSLDDLLAGFGPAAATPPQPTPVDSRKSLDADPLGGLFAEAPAQRPVMAPDRDVGTTQGDHAPPQRESFTLAPRVVAAPVIASGGDPERLLASFLEGAGLRRDDLGVVDAETQMRELGAAFAAMAEGLRALLAARALVKDHAGLERTMIRAADNNPLKHSASAREAALALIRQREAGYLPPRAAIDASFRDLQAHELAVLEGIKASVQALLDRFHPQELEATLEASSTFADLLRGGRRARLWEAYMERYGEIAAAARRRFMGDLDQTFRKAYEAKVESLKSTRKGDFDL